MKYICESHEETTSNLNLNYLCASFRKYLHFIYICFGYLNPVHYGGGGGGFGGGGAVGKEMGGGLKKAETF